MPYGALRCVAAVAAAAWIVTCVPVAAADQERLKHAVESLRRAQGPSGAFRYDFDVLAGVSSGEDDAVRQAFAIACLAEYLVASGDSSIKPLLTRALERFEALSLPIGKSGGQELLEWTGLLSVPTGRHKLASVLNPLHLLYRPLGPGAVVSLERQYARAWAGATALALFAELQYAEATGDARFDAARARWLEGLATLYVPGHGFRVAPTLIHISPFADGEGWLALAYYEQRRPGHATATSILNGLEERLMRRYEQSFSIAFYQWGTMAAAIRWDSTKRPRFAAFIEHQTVNALKWLSEPQPNNTCATMEGLATAARVLREAGGRSALLSEIDQKVTTEMRKNYEFQIPPNSNRLDLGNGVAIVSPRLEEFGGAFLHERTRPYTRIDFTGHCVSAMVKLQRLRSRQ